MAKRRRRRPLRGALKAVLVASTAFVCAPGDGPRAARTTFLPEVSLGVYRTNNVQYVGAPGATAADWFATLSVALPVEHEWKAGRASFQYVPSVTRQQTYSSLNRVDQLFGANVELTPSERSSLSLDASYLRNQQQGNPQSLENSDLFVATRTDRKIFRGGLTYRSSLTRRWTLEADANASIERYAPIANFDTTAPVVTVEDRNNYLASLQMTRSVSAKDGLGGQYAYTRFDLQSGQQQDVHLVGLTWDRATSKDSKVEMKLGGFYRKTGYDVASPLADAPVSDSGFSGLCTWDRQWSRTTLRLEASYLPSSGGSLRGTSTNGTLGVSLANRQAVRWKWQASARYVRRVPTLDVFSSASLTTWAAGGQLEWLPRLPVGIRMGAEYVRQVSNEALFPDGSFVNGGVGFVWYPLGRNPRRT